MCEDAECAICLSPFNFEDSRPVVICPAKHVACSNCCEQMERSSKEVMRCPFCRRIIAPKLLHTHRGLMMTLWKRAFRVDHAHYFITNDSIRCCSCRSSLCDLRNMWICRSCLFVDPFGVNGEKIRNGAFCGPCASKHVCSNSGVIDRFPFYYYSKEQAYVEAVKDLLNLRKGMCEHDCDWNLMIAVVLLRQKMIAFRHAKHTAREVLAVFRQGVVCILKSALAEVTCASSSEPVPVTQELKNFFGLLLLCCHEVFVNCVQEATDTVLQDIHFVVDEVYELGRKRSAELETAIVARSNRILKSIYSSLQNCGELAPVNVYSIVTFVKYFPIECEVWLEFLNVAYLRTKTMSQEERITLKAIIKEINISFGNQIR